MWKPRSSVRSSYGPTSCRFTLLSTPKTFGLVDGIRLGSMKLTAYLINTARGPIVEEAALVAALSEGRLAGAGLDVFDTEPLPGDHPLTRLENVVLTPPMGWTTDMRYERFAKGTAELSLDCLDGKEVPWFTASAAH